MNVEINRPIVTGAPIERLLDIFRDSAKVVYDQSVQHVLESFSTLTTLNTFSAFSYR